jgi:hypothetical protein
LGKDNRSPWQVTGDSGGGVAKMGGEMYFTKSVPPPDAGVRYRTELAGNYGARSPGIGAVAEADTQQS